MRNAWGILCLIASAGCNGASTQDLLDLKFLGVGSQTLSVIAPASVQQAREFDVTVQALTGNALNTRYNKNLRWVLVKGSGTLTATASTGFSGGVQKVTLRYDNNAITNSAPEAVQFRVEDTTDSRITSSAVAVLATVYVNFTGFSVAIPGNVTAHQSFSTTVTALGTDGQPFVTYSGTVNLTLATGIGSITPNTVTGFSNGVATASLVFDGAAGELRLKATDASDTSKTGLSNTAPVGYGIGEDYSLNFNAVPLSTSLLATTIRLNWNKVAGANSYDIYLKNAGGTYDLIQSVASTTFYFTHTGRTTGTLYEYRIQAINASLSVIASATSQATPKTCTDILAGADSNITGATTWSKANSPYCIKSNVTVTGTLTIAAGVVMLIDGGMNFTVNSGGLLTALGAASDLIVFTSPLAAPAGGNWGLNANPNYGGLFFNLGAIGTTFDAQNNYQSGSGLRYVVIEYANRAVMSNVPMILEYSLIRFNTLSATSSTYGAGVSMIYNSGTTSVIRSSQFNSNMQANTAGVLDGSGVIGAAGAMGNATNIFEKNVISYNGPDYSQEAWNMKGGGTHTVRQNLFYANTEGTLNSDSGCAGTATISNNLFAKNGGPLAHCMTNIAISNNTFSDNTNGDISGDNILGSGGTITNNSFLRSRANGNGGAINLPAATNTTITNNVFDSTYSSAGHGGAIYVTGTQPNLTISYNTFLNTYTAGAANHGGAIYIDADTSANRNIRYNYFNGSWAKGSSAQGGAIYVKTGNNSGLKIQHNNFNNTRIGLAGTTMNVIGTDQAGAGFAIDNDLGVPKPRNWWGVDLSAYTACSTVVPSTYCTNNVAWDPPINPAAAAWPLCSTAPSDPDCVGAP